MIPNFPITIACVGLTCLAPIAAMADAAPIPAVTFSQVAPVQVLYDYNKTVCSPDHYIPDGPARAWKRADGKFTLIAEEADNFELVGTTPFNLKAVCRPILSDDYPNGYDSTRPASSQYSIAKRGYVGIEATYTLDGKTVYGFAGEDLSPLAYAAGCVDKGTGNCWLNGITAVKSNDQGDDFNFSSNTLLDVAAVSRTISTTRTGYSGYITSSNIIHKSDGYYYMFTNVADNAAGRSADCLIRTNNLDDPTSWRGWDGKGFNASTQSSITGEANSMGCVPVGAYSLWDNVYSLQYIPRKNLYIALMQSRLEVPGDTQNVPGAYYSTSSDLIHWSPYTRLAVTPTVAGYDSQTEVDAYPVLIDPWSLSRNYETIDSNYPVMIYTKVVVANGGVTLDRNLVAEPFLMK